MKQWDTNQWVFPHGSHPCIIISPTARCQNPDFDTVNVLACQSHRAQRLPRESEFRLDAADGMDWETLVRCDFIWAVRKSELKQPRGRVVEERRRAIGQKLIRIFGLWLG
jgi:mRNA-degrading endonuclease toxin of MazEF toxin-antitoxin module